MKIGYFGKLPSYGDFVQRNVSPVIIDIIDNWLLQAMESSRGVLRDNWQQTYFNSPIWRFVLSDGIVSDKVITGFMMPSIDKVGRSYPFTVICELESNVNPFILARKLNTLHEKSEDFVLSLLENPKPNLEDIQQILDDLYSKPREHSFLSILNSTLSSSSELTHVIDQDLDDLSSCSETFLENILANQQIKVSLWWTSGGVDFMPTKRYFSGLPPVDSYISFLLGTENK